MDNDCFDDSGFSPLMKASEVGDLLILKDYYLYGKDIDEPEIEGVTPLMIGI